MRILGTQVLFPLSKRQWRLGILLFVAFLGAMRISSALFAAPAIIFPASGIALGALFLTGPALWPFVYLAAVTGYLLAGASPLTLLILPVVHTAFALVGAYILRRVKIDPLFRRTRDMFWFIGTAFLVSAIVPTFGNLARYLNEIVYGIPLSAVTWESWYVATVFSTLFVGPFVIRWFAKPRFTRTGLHVFEIIGAFALLTAFAFFLFWTENPSIAGISIAYLLLIPLFWIALRLRPRFLTLGLLVIAVVGIAGTFLGPHGLSPEALGNRLFQTEIFFIILSLIFYTLAALEEERRVTTTLMQTQVAGLENAITRLSSEDRAKKEFIAVLAHELRNPLAPVVSTIEFLKLKGSPDKEKLAAFELMENRMNTVKRLLDDLLDVSRISEKKLSLEKEVIDLGTIVRRAALSSEPYFKERYQSLSIRLPNELLYVEADPVRFEQVLTNLLTNASKFSNSRDRIVIEAKKMNGHAEVTVVDRGIGIEPEMQRHVFEPFHQVEEGERTKKGLGIGLSLVKNIMEMHDGSARVESEGRGHGSRFIVSIPLAASERIAEMEATRSTRAHEELQDVHDTGRGLVLIVDDNDAAAAAVGKLLELTGRSVEYAYDGAQAIEKGLSLHPDAIVLDIGLPDMTGHDVARGLRTGGYNGPLIALSGYSLEEEKRKGEEAGFDHYLIKPVGLAELRKVLPAH